MLNQIQRVLGLKAKGTPLKVGWLLLGDINTGSSRIHGLNIHNFLIKNGIESIIFQSSPGMNSHLLLSIEEQETLLRSGVNVLVFQKIFDENAIRLAEKAKSRKIRTIFLISDKHETEMVRTVDQLIVTSDFLKGHFDANFGTNAVVIEDAIESSAHLHKTHSYTKPLELVWVGQSDNWGTLEVVRNAIEKIARDSFRLKTISNHPDADVQWNVDTIHDEILKGDIGVIPALDSEWGKAKSNNRLTMFMALGIPVVASDIPSYRKIIEDSRAGFLVTCSDEWSIYLELLINTDLREKLGSKARAYALGNYNIDVIGSKWLSLLKQIRTRC